MGRVLVFKLEYDDMAGAEGFLALLKGIRELPLPDSAFDTHGSEEEEAA